MNGDVEEIKQLIQSKSEVDELKALTTADTKVEPIPFCEFGTETDLVIIGTKERGILGDSFDVTDDYYGINFMVGDKEIDMEMETGGFVSVVTIPKFNKIKAILIKNSGSPDLSNLGIECVLLPNFKGKIGVLAVDAESEQYRNDFDVFGEPIIHQGYAKDADCGEDDSEYDKVVLVLPEDTELVELPDFVIPLGHLKIGRAHV